MLSAPINNVRFYLKSNENIKSWMFRRNVDCGGKDDTETEPEQEEEDEQVEKAVPNECIVFAYIFSCQFY